MFCITAVDVRTDMGSIFLLTKLVFFIIAFPFYFNFDWVVV